MKYLNGEIKPVSFKIEIGFIFLYLTKDSKGYLLELFFENKLYFYRAYLLEDLIGLLDILGIKEINGDSIIGVLGEMKELSEYILQVKRSIFLNNRVKFRKYE